MKKITLIGAGSVVFAKNLISDILQFPELSACTICLMDIEPARLETARTMAERVVRKLGVRAKIEATLDRRKAIAGSHYVICTIQVGGYKPGTVIDFKIPRKYGLLQTIGDTLGVGGVFRGLRTIPKVLEIARDVADVGAPDCTLLNYTNPMAILCMAVNKSVGIPMVGLCHSVQGTCQQLANYAGLDMRHITYRVAGINHMAFFLDFKYRGQDAYPFLFQLLNDPGFTQDKVRFEMMRRLGYFVTESSEHQSEYTPHFIHHGRDVIKKFDIPIDEYLRRCESIISSWKRTEAELIGTMSDISVGTQTHEYGSFIIHSIETNTPRVVYGNVPNTGLITNLPDRCCVELPVLVDAQGLQPTCIGDLPPQLAAICRTNINVQELTVAAALTGRRDYIYHAAMTDPHTAATLPLDKIWAMCDDLIEAHQKVGLLGEFSPTIKNTGRSYAGTGDKVIVTIDPTQPLTEITGEPIYFALSATNHGHKAFSGELTLKSSPVAISVKKGNTFLKIATGATVTKRILLSPDSSADSLSLRLLADDARVLGREYIFNKPRCVPIPKTGRADVEIPFMSNTLLKAQISVESGLLEITGRVIDTAIRLDEACPWMASSIEIFLRPAGGAQPMQQWFLMPRAKEATVLAITMEKDPRLTLKTTLDKSGYNFTLCADLGKLGIQKETDDAFYLDIVVNAGALGDAHGACRVGWNERTDSASHTDHYALIIPKRNFI